MVSFAEAYETIPGNGWLYKSEAELLWNVARATEGPILEVGCYEGRSTCLLAQLGRPVYAVDPFDNFSDSVPADEIERRFLDNIQSRGYTNVELFRCDIAAWNPKRIGFAYLDGGHTQLGTLIQIARARRGGAREMCIHDYAESGGGLNVKKAIEGWPLKIVQIVERMAHCRFVPGDLDL